MDNGLKRSIYHDSKSISSLIFQEVNAFNSDSFFDAESVRFTDTTKYADPTSYADAISRNFGRKHSIMK